MAEMRLLHQSQLMVPQLCKYDPLFLPATILHHPARPDPHLAIHCPHSTQVMDTHPTDLQPPSINLDGRLSEGPAAAGDQTSVLCWKMGRTNGFCATYVPLSPTTVIAENPVPPGSQGADCAGSPYVPEHVVVDDVITGALQWISQFLWPIHCTLSHRDERIAVIQRVTVAIDRHRSKSSSPDAVVAACILDSGTRAPRVLGFGRSLIRIYHLAKAGFRLQAEDPETCAVAQECWDRWATWGTQWSVAVKSRGMDFGSFVSPRAF
ncbi:hypothetical protein DFP72DRAFT_1050253 [Ephemerocybe angulata]|uniref:Uncharacterized protein n=1 Tax=Ephemerocybe angulata TaxID=980116 RepID=A0A8H6M0L5_9AGAR|nr:hypothetical protein DFP72DRAFT_1050253 [Tulosesus angulatus]